MNRETALKRSRRVGLGSVAIGMVLLLVRPERFGRLNAAASEAMNKRGIYLGHRSTKVHVALYRRSGGRIGATCPAGPAPGSP